MTVPETWPNYQGSAKEGVRVIIDHHGFSSDVEYGKTKIFIRTPKTVFSMERFRAEKIPSLVHFLQKVDLLFIFCRRTRLGVISYIKRCMFVI